MANADFEEKDTQVLGISVDPKPVQTAFSASLGSIPYPILGDFHPHGAVAQLYGIYNDENGRARRSVIIVDKQGTVRFKQVYASVAELDTADILAEIDKL